MWHTMQSQQLKRLIDAGSYRPEPALVAQAMLRRRSVRNLLVEGEAPISLTAADRSRSSSGARRQAA